MLLAMKLARFDNDRFGVLLADDRVVDVAASVPAYPEADDACSGANAVRRSAVHSL